MKMRIGLTVTLIALLAASFPASGSARPDTSLDLPPPNLLQSTAQLRDVLLQHAKTVKRLAGHDTAHEEWSFVDTGLRGTEVLDRSGTDYHSVITTDAHSEEFGQVAGQRWHKDSNGFVTHASNTESGSFFALRVLEDAADPKNEVTVAGETAGSNPAYVLRVVPAQAKHPEWIFFEKSTGNVVRVERISRGRRVISTYDDYKTVDGITQPWHIHDSWWDSALDDDYRVTAFHGGMPIRASRFAMPASTPAPGTSLRQLLPAQFLFGSIVVRVNIGGRGLDFELDSSQPESVIDYDVANQLGLPTYGQATKLSTGAKVGYWTTLGDAKTGSLSLTGMKIRALPIAYNPSDHIKVVGVLGYDFFANYEIHIDFMHHQVEVLPDDMLRAQQPVVGGINLPFELDDGVPLVQMQLADTLSKRVVLNCTFPFTVVFGAFVSAHGYLHPPTNKSSKVFVPFADKAAYGGEASVWIAAMPMTFSLAHLDPSYVLATTDYYDQPENADAMVGYDYLRYFDIWFDYPHNRIFVEPNGRFTQDFPAAKTATK